MHVLNCYVALNAVAQSRIRHIIWYLEPKYVNLFVVRKNDFEACFTRIILNKTIKCNYLSMWKLQFINFP